MNTNNQTFVELYLSGQVEENAIDDWIEAWHDSPDNTKLHEYLGMNDKQYDEWLVNPTRPLRKILSTPS